MDMRIELGTGMDIAMRTDMCICMCIGMHTDMSIGMCTEMCIDVHRHVYSPVRTSCPWAIPCVPHVFTYIHNHWVYSPWDVWALVGSCGWLCEHEGQSALLRQVRAYTHAHTQTQTQTQTHTHMHARTCGDAWHTLAAAGAARSLRCRGRGDPADAACRGPATAALAVCAGHTMGS